jgi:hypothetical protein
VLGKESITFAKVAIEIMLPELMTEPVGLLMGQRGLMADGGMREIARVRATIANMREPVVARPRSAMVGQALSRRAGVSGVTGEMSGTPRMDAARVDRATMRAADVTDMHATTVTAMHAATVSGKTAKMGCTAADMPATAAEVRGTTAAEVSAAAAAKMRATTTATAEMRRGHCERKGGNCEAQSGRQSSNNPTRHSTTPTI